MTPFTPTPLDITLAALLVVAIGAAFVGWRVMASSVELARVDAQAWERAWRDAIDACGQAERDLADMRVLAGEAQEKITRMEAQADLREKGWRTVIGRMTAERAEVEAEWESALHDQVTALTTERDTALAEVARLTASAHESAGQLLNQRNLIVELREELSHAVLFRVAGGRLGTRQAWMDWRSGKGAVAVSEGVAA